LVAEPAARQSQSERDSETDQSLHALPEVGQSTACGVMAVEKKKAPSGAFFAFMWHAQPCWTASTHHQSLENTPMHALTMPPTNFGSLMV
jgi:hypothetical protein